MARSLLREVSIGMPMIAVTEPGRCTDALAALAEETGRHVAQGGFALICGVLPGRLHPEANPFVTIPIATKA